MPRLKKKARLSRRAFPLLLLVPFPRDALFARKSGYEESAGAWQDCGVKRPQCDLAVSVTQKPQIRVECLCDGLPSPSPGSPQEPRSPGHPPRRGFFLSGSACGPSFAVSSAVEGLAPGTWARAIGRAGTGSGKWAVFELLFLTSRQSFCPAFTMLSFCATNRASPRLESHQPIPRRSDKSCVVGY
jgi:hypothetical protein